MSGNSYWQNQAFSVDSKFNSLRTPGCSNFRTLYIRRRNQLLRTVNITEEFSAARKQYVYIRVQLLQQRYNVNFDQYSNSSRSLRSASRMSLTPEGSFERFFEKKEGNVVPTKQAEASRAIVGDTTMSENYAFVGVHHIFDQHANSVPIVKFANNNREKLCCVSYDGTLSICNVASNPTVECVLKMHTKSVTGCDWSESNDLLVSCAMDGFICLWNIPSYTCIRKVRGPTTNGLCACLFHPVNNNMVVVGSEDGVVAVLNISTGIYPREGTCKIGGQILSLAFDGNGVLLWAGSDKGVITSLSFGSSGLLHKCKRMVIAENCAITSLSYRAWMSREARDPTLLVNCAANVACLFDVCDKNGNLKLKKKFLVRHKNGKNIIHSTFCPIMSFREGACIVSGSEDSCVYFLDILKDSNFVVNKLQGHACPVLGVNFNYDESMLATSDNQGLVIIWSREKDTNFKSNLPTK